ncbi:hypothetical protein EYF80_029201 [Liparis tanakae]|uniref:Uncharacterized protein n=1 Tax=Liparis tanakae TaxID=230148 RepID=A0A4Z2H542_9TELE|nr:hypothetical protein EYF80_029201 [Liparis tanakae]
MQKAAAAPVEPPAPYTSLCVTNQTDICAFAFSVILTSGLDHKSGSHERENDIRPVLMLQRDQTFGFQTTDGNQNASNTKIIHRWITVSVGSDRHGAQSMHLNDFSRALTEREAGPLWWSPEWEES